MGLFSKLKGAAVSKLKQVAADPANRALVMGQAQKFAGQGVSALQKRVAAMRRGGKVKRYGRTHRRRGRKGRFV
jgi:hypothetical protein